MAIVTWLVTINRYTLNAVISKGEHFDEFETVVDIDVDNTLGFKNVDVYDESGNSAKLEQIKKDGAYYVETHYQLYMTTIYTKFNDLSVVLGNDNKEYVYENLELFGLFKKVQVEENVLNIIKWAV